MSISINTSQSTSVKSALNRNLIAANMAATKMATGDAIINAYEDPTSMTIGLNMRSDLRVLRTVLKGIEQSQSMLYLAEAGARAIYDTTSQMKEILTQAKLGYMTDDLVKKTLSPTYTQLKAEINRIADSVNFNGQTLLNGQSGAKNAGKASVAATTPTAYHDNGNATTKLTAFTADNITVKAGIVDGGLPGNVTFKAPGTPAPTVSGGTITTADNGDVIVNGAKLLFSGVTAKDTTTTHYSSTASSITGLKIAASGTILSGLIAETVTSGKAGAVTFKASGTGVAPTVTGGTVTTDPDTNSIIITGATIKYTGIIVTDSAAATGNGDLEIKNVTLTYSVPAGTAMTFASGNLEITSEIPIISNVLPANVTYTAASSPGTITAVSIFTGTPTMDTAFTLDSNKSTLTNITNNKSAVGNLVVDNVNLRFKAGQFAYADGTITSKAGFAPEVSGLNFSDLSFQATNTDGGLLEIGSFYSDTPLGPITMTPATATSAASIGNLRAEYGLSGGIAATSGFSFVAGSDLNDDVVILDLPNMRLNASNGVLGMIDTLNSTDNISETKPTDLTDLRSVIDANADIPLVQALLDSMIGFIDEIGAYETRLMNIAEQLQSNVAQLDDAQGVFLVADLADETENFVRANVQIAIAISALKQMNSTLQALQQLATG